MFLLFGGMYYYPAGGMDDLIGKYNMYTAAFNALQELNIFTEWAQIYNIDTGEVWRYTRHGKMQEWEEV